MKFVQLLILSFVVLTMVGCASSQDRAYEAQEGVHKQRLALVEKYQQCMKEAGGDKMKEEGCDQYLKASEALK